MRKTQVGLGLLLLCVVNVYCGAQIPNRPPSISDTLQTVKVASDNRVTFSVYAPKASAVTVSGDFLLGAPPANMAKNDDGVWSFTSNPIPPDS
jgi:Carbohydrate-binding module 48 (Isoamylase N-terminal domain)